MKYLKTYKIFESMRDYIDDIVSSLKYDLEDAELGDILLQYKDKGYICEISNIKLGEKMSGFTLIIKFGKYYNGNWTESVRLEDVKDDMEFAINYILNSYHVDLEHIYLVGNEAIDDPDIPYIDRADLNTTIPIGKGDLFTNSEYNDYEFIVARIEFYI